MITQDINNHQ